MSGYRGTVRWVLVLPFALLLAGCGGGRHTISDCLSPTGSGSGDIARHQRSIDAADLCYRRETVREGGFLWTFHVLENRRAADGPFWVLPHDNENSAFEAALHAVLTYGGGLLAVDSAGQRNFRGQDPNRNFSSSAAESRLCIGQRAPAPAYTRAVLDHYKGRRGPYLAMHNNRDGWQGNGGSGTISINRTNAVLYSFRGSAPSGPLRDEDNLVIMAGPRTPAGDPAVRQRIAALNAAGLNVQYKQVTASSFDCSLSDYVARHRLGEYYNIEAEHGSTAAQIAMTDRLMSVLGIRRLRGAAANPFLD